MANQKERKNKPAGVNDNFNVGYTYFATNNEKTQLKTGEGHEFDNDELLKALGFKDKNGVMTLSAFANSIEKDEKGKISKRTSQGRTLTENKKSAKQDNER